MLRRFFAYSSLLLSVGMLCWWTPVLAHDAFYPHHREDFENMTRRRELRGTVLLSTAVFLCVLGTVVYLALRKSKDTDKTDENDTKTVQKRLESAANSAVDTAKRVLNAEGNVSAAAEKALTTYAEASGVTWRPHSDRKSRAESVPYQIRCKIGSDVVTLSIDAEVIQLKAEHDFSKTGFGSQRTAGKARTSVVLRIGDKEQ
ncbi:MAG: hypothetical protein OXH39_07330 [Candidatus Poribacteria bacterium]|nr:hypothetical protein [Candidatus Poribacteria bacterium]